jgi:hypothetical protein
MEAAQKEPLFSNTLFVFVGDHGVAGNARAVYPDLWTEQRLTDQHVPLLFYAPQLLAPARHQEVVSQIDVLPTIFGLLNQPFEQVSLGRDLLSPDKHNDFAFVTNTSDRIGMVTNDHYFSRNVNSGEELLLPLNPRLARTTLALQDSIRNRLSGVTQAYADMARFLIFHNRQN